jgi:EAL domain-containing protein (putative c-di-GMP-specific phosphodiesterase class I)
MTLHTIERAWLENELRGALERGEFHLVYQPVFRMANEAMYGVEALLRWNHSERGIIGPDAFIPVAEDTGLIIPIGTWVLQEACHQAAQWLRDDAVGVALAVGVNLSPRQLAQPNLAGDLARILAETGLDPPLLWLEITESAVAEDPERAVATLIELKGLGVRVAIDDFGSGYSWFSYLQRYPVDTLKIDRSFVKSLEAGSDNSAIVAGIIRMAQALDLTVVAEGVETSAQLEQLAQLDCDMTQGFYLSRPVPGRTITALLHDQTAKPLVTRS